MAARGSDFAKGHKFGESLPNEDIQDDFGQLAKAETDEANVEDNVLPSSVPPPGGRGSPILDLTGILVVDRLFYN